MRLKAKKNSLSQDQSTIQSFIEKQLTKEIYHEKNMHRILKYERAVRKLFCFYPAMEARIGDRIERKCFPR